MSSATLNGQSNAFLNKKVKKMADDKDKTYTEGEVRDKFKDTPV
ncbi:hypothetical protein V0M98_09730 [Pseudomonas silesiensis]